MKEEDLTSPTEGSSQGVPLTPGSSGGRRKKTGVDFTSMSKDGGNEGNKTLSPPSPAVGSGVRRKKSGGDAVTASPQQGASPRRGRKGSGVTTQSTSPILRSSGVGSSGSLQYRGGRSSGQLRDSQHIRSQLWDMDVLKSQTILNARPKHRATQARKQTLRMLLFPFFAVFWFRASWPAQASTPASFQISRSFFCVAALLYVSQVVAFYVYFRRDPGDPIWRSVGDEEVVAPLIFHLLLSFMWGRTASGAWGEDPRDQQQSVGDKEEVESDAESDAEEEDNLATTSPLDSLHTSGMVDDGGLSTPRNLRRITGGRAENVGGGVSDAEDNSDDDDRLNVLEFHKVSKRKPAGTPVSPRFRSNTFSWQARKRSVRVPEVRDCILRAVDKRVSNRAVSPLPFLCAFVVASVPTAHRFISNWRKEWGLFCHLLDADLHSVLLQFPGALLTALLWPQRYEPGSGPI
eukprot:Hpha_TRINITY_DN6782_c0_g1::TRINITY_DN6782_c0_g1_i1::g.111020::m.111020